MEYIKNHKGTAEYPRWQKNDVFCIFIAHWLG